MSGFGTLQPRTGNKDSVKLDEVIDLHKFPADEWSQIRCLPGKILPVKRHWISIIAGKDKKEITIPRYCIAFDPNHEGEPRKDAKGKEVKCPYCDLTHGKDGSARYEFFYLGNAIIRELQEDEPRKKAEHTKEEKKTGFKDIRSKSWTPVRVCRFTSTMASRIQEIGEGNTAKDKKSGTKKAFDVTHEKYGCDIRVKFKPKAPGTDKYSIDKDERTPLTEDEKAYLVWKLDETLLDVTGRMDPKQALEDFKRMEIVGGDTPSDGDDDDGYSLGDDDGKSKKKKKKGKPAFSDDDDDDDDGDSKKSKSKKKSKPAFSDDDDDEEDDDDGDSKKSKSKKSKSDKSSKKSKKSSDAKSSKSKKSKKSSDDDDDDDDTPKKSKGSKSDKGKKSKSDKSSKDKKSKKSSKGKKPVWDDDDE